MVNSFCICMMKSFKQSQIFNLSIELILMFIKIIKNELFLFTVLLLLETDAVTNDKNALNK